MASASGPRHAVISITYYGIQSKGVIGSTAVLTGNRLIYREKTR